MSVAGQPDFAFEFSIHFASIENATTCFQARLHPSVLISKITFPVSQVCSRVQSMSDQIRYVILTEILQSDSQTSHTNTKYIFCALLDMDRLPHFQCESFA